MGRPAPALAAALALATLASAVAGPLLAVDLGGEYMKIAVVTQGSTRASPIQVVTNEMSRRRTPAAVAYAADGRRLIGDDAAAAASRRPASSVLRLRPLLGVNASDVPDGGGDPWNAALKVVPVGARGGAGIETPAGPKPAEELAASLLHHARRLAEASLAAAGTPSSVKDVVVTVPPRAPPAARAALVDAAAAANLTLLSLVSSPAAAALAYGIERSWNPTASRVLFYEQGSTRTAAALVDFRSTGGPAGAGSFSIVDLAAADIGSDALDALLFDRAAAAFEAKHPDAGLSTDARAKTRLRAAVRRTKEILSANADAPLTVEELAGGHDLRMTVTRADLEKDATAAGFFDASVAPVVAILKDNKVKPAALAAVELVGGGTRVPGLQAALTKALSGRKLDRHMDADEAVLHGAALFGANASTAFRLRRFGGADAAPAALALFSAPIDAKGARLAPPAPLPAPLLPWGHPLAARRVAKLTPTAGAAGVELTLAFDVAASRRGVPGVPHAASLPAPKKGALPHADLVVGTWTVTGLAGALADKGGPARIDIVFSPTGDGRLAPTRADALTEYEETYEVKTEVEDEEEEVKAAAVPETNTTETNGTAPTPTPKPKKYKTETKTRTRVARAGLKIGGFGLAAPRAPPADADALAKSLAAAADADAAAAAAAAAKNELEAFILASRSRLDAATAIAEGDGDDSDADATALAATSTPDERGALGAALTDAEDWLYGEGEAEGAAAFVAKKAEVAALADPLFLRASERTALPAALDEAAAVAAAVAADAKAWKKARPWLPAKSLDTLAADAAALSRLVTKDGAAARKAPPTAPPKLLSSAVAAKTAALEEARAELARVPEPKKEEDKKEKKDKKDDAKKVEKPSSSSSQADGDGDGSHDEL